MINEIKTICKACKSCQTAKVRRQHLSAAFEIEQVPLLFVNDEAKEFVDGLVHSVMNRYVGIMQITTGGIALDLT